MAFDLIATERFVKTHGEPVGFGRLMQLGRLLRRGFLTPTACRSAAVPAGGPSWCAGSDRTGGTAMMRPQEHRPSAEHSDAADWDSSDKGALLVEIGPTETVLRTTIDGALLSAAFGNDHAEGLTFDEFMSQHDVISAFVTARLGPVYDSGQSITPDLQDLPVAGSGIVTSADRIHAIEILRTYRVGAGEVAGVKNTLLGSGTPYRLVSPAGTREGTLDGAGVLALSI